MASKLNLYISAFVATLTSALFGYSVGLTGGLIVLPSFLDHYGLLSLSPSTLAAVQSQIVTIWLVGALLGVPLGIPTCARWGRKTCLAQCACLFLAGVVVQLVSNNLVIFELGRLVNGVGVGIGTLVGPMYISEISPSSERGMIMSGYQTLLQISALVGFWGAYAAQCLVADSSNLQWQILIIVQLIPGILLLLGIFFIPETPHYLASKAEIEKATQSLSWLRSLPPTDFCLKEEIHEMELAAKLQSEIQSPRPGSFLKEAISKPIRKRLFVGIGLMIAQNMPDAPVIFMSAGFSSVSSSLFLTGLFGVVKLVSAMAFMFFFVRMRGNRFWLKLGTGICGASMVILAYCVRSIMIRSTSVEAGMTAAGLVAIFMVYIFAFAFGVSLGPISWNVCAEIFPLHISDKCCAVTTCTQWMFQIVIAGITPRLITSVGWITYLIYAVFCFIAYVWIAVYVPETRGVALGKTMDELFPCGQSSAAVVPSSAAAHEANGDELADEYTALLQQAGERHRRRSSFAVAI